MDKIKDTLVFFAGHGDCPDAFALVHPALTASALHDLSVNNDWSNLTFGAVIGRFCTHLGQESEVIIHRLAFEVINQFFLL